MKVRESDQRWAAKIERSERLRTVRFVRAVRVMLRKSKERR